MGKREEREEGEVEGDQRSGRDGHVVYERAHVVHIPVGVSLAHSAAARRSPLRRATAGLHRSPDTPKTVLADAQHLWLFFTITSVIVSNFRATVVRKAVFEPRVWISMQCVSYTRYNHVRKSCLVPPRYCGRFCAHAPT